MRRTEPPPPPPPPGRALRDTIEQFLAEAGPAAVTEPRPAAAGAPAAPVAAEAFMPPVFLCPLTGAIMRDPVVDRDGNRRAPRIRVARAHARFLALSRSLSHTHTHTNTHSDPAAGIHKTHLCVSA